MSSSEIIASIPKVELLQYSPLLENICALFHLNKITKDAAIAMLKIEFDLVLYETMMSRNINFRPRDLSSAFKDVKFTKYINRLFQKGDEKLAQKSFDNFIAKVNKLEFQNSDLFYHFHKQFLVKLGVIESAYVRSPTMRIDSITQYEIEKIIEDLLIK